MADTDVIIIGAGLAGLTCARHLHRRGISFTLLEQTNRVGGRVRTDVVDGFRLDRGFQVLLTAYPEAQAELDYDALGLHPFYAGALVRHQGRFHRVADPFRHPADGVQTLFSPVGSLLDKLKVAGLRLGVTLPSLSDLLAREERTTLEALQERWGFSDAMIDRFFRPFIGGIVLDGDLRASSRMFEFVFRMFSLGRAALPAAGMEALPRQLAEPLPDAAVRLNTRVEAISDGRVMPESGEALSSDAVVVATEATAAAQLTGDRSIRTAARPATCLYYAADAAPIDEPILMLNSDQNGPVNNFTVLTNVAPSYAPSGRVLMSAAVLDEPEPDDERLEEAVRKQLAGWFGPSVRGWEHLRTYHIPYALPEQAPPFLAPPERPVRHTDGLYVCGDHRSTASINGAINAGRRAADAVLADFGR